jgi:hypothetical protein
MRCFTRQVHIMLLAVFLAAAVSGSTGRGYMEVPLTSSSAVSEASNFLRAPVVAAEFRRNTTDPFMQLKAMREFRAQVERERERKNRLKDRHNHRSNAKQVYDKLPKSPEGKIERVSEEEWEQIDAKQKERGLSWFGDSGSGGSAYSNSILADPGAYYDKWAQAYRMLGGFIDCDNVKSENSHDNGNNNQNNNDGNSACSRWMMWAAVSFCLFVVKRF